MFVDEQGVNAAIEFDEHDESATHYIAFCGEIPVGTARTLNYSPTVKIGRVAVLEAYRGHGVGLAIMQHVIGTSAAAGFNEAVLHSQTAVVPFYERLGFISEGTEFLEADIPHFRMRRVLP